MSRTHVFIVNGTRYSIPDEELDAFMADFPDAQECEVLNVDGEEYSIPPEERDEFMADMEANGRAVKPMESLMMDDGQMLTVGREDMRQFVQARRQGLPISRTMATDNTGIPDWYVKSESDRMKMADALGDMFYPENEDERAKRIERIVGGYDGNIDHKGRQMLINRDEDGRVNGYSTTSSTVIKDDDGKFVVVPTVVTDEDGNTIRLADEEEAKGWYLQTGENYGKFRSAAQAKDAVNNIHEYHQRIYQPQWNKYILEHMSEMNDEIRNDPGVQNAWRASQQRKIDAANESVESPAVSAVKGFGEGLVRSVTDADALWEETYGDNAITTALRGANANANKLVKVPGEMGAAIDEAIGKVGGVIGSDLAKAIENNAISARQQMDELFPSKVSDAVGFEDWSTKASELSGNVAAMLYKFGPVGKSPEIMEVVFGSDGANAALNTYRDYKDKGKSDLEALTAASVSGLVAYESGKLLSGEGKAAQTLSKSGNKVADFLIGADKTGLVMGAQKAADKAVENYGKNKPIDEGTAEAFNEGAAEGAMFHAANAVPGLLDAGMRSGEVRRSERRVAENVRKEVARDEARTRYEANLSDEARSDIETRVNDIVKTGVIPSYRHAQEVERLAAEKLGGRERGESTEAVEQAVMEAAQEVADRLATPERVTSPALERRQTEAEMRENERLTKIGEKIGEEIANEKPIEPTEDAEAVKADEAERVKRRKEDFEAALEDDEINRNPEQVDNQTPEKGEIVSENPVETPETSPSAMSSAFTKMTDAINEGLRGGRATKKQADADAEIRRIAGEMANTDDPLPTDAEIDAITASVPEAKRGIVAENFRKYRDWVAEQRVAAKDDAETAESEVPDGRGKMVEKKNVAGRNGQKTEDMRDPATRESVAKDSSVGNGVEIPASKEQKRTYFKRGNLKKRMKDIRGSKFHNDERGDDIEITKDDATEFAQSKYSRWLSGFLEQSNAKVARKFDKTNSRKAVPAEREIPELPATGESVANIGSEVNGASHGELSEVRTWAKRTWRAKVAAIENLASIVKSAKDPKHTDYAQMKDTPGHEKNTERDANRWGGGMDEYAIRFSVPDSSGKRTTYDARMIVRINKDGKRFVYDIVDLNDGSPVAKMFADEYAKRKISNSNTQERKTIGVADDGSVAKSSNGVNATSKLTDQKAVGSNTVEMRNIDPKRRSDPKAIAWAQKRGFSVVDGKITPEARRAYDEDVTKKTASLSKRWFPDMKVVQHKHGENIEHGQEVIDLRDTSGNTLGWFNPSNKEVHLLPGANAETVAHEIMWHGTRDWATTEAAKGNEAAKKLLATMKDVERNVPDALKNKVTRLYRANGVSSADVLFNEWGAWFTMGKGGAALESAMKTAEGRKWYAKALATVKDAYKDYMSAHGGNRADISEIDGMTRDQFVDWLSKNFSGGKTLGEIGTPKDTTLSTEETLKQKARRIAYDSVAPVRDLEREIEKNTGVKIKAEDSVDAALALRPGEHEAVAINQQRQLREVKDMLKKYGLSSEDLGYYMALKAAPGRDAKIDAKNLSKIEADVEAEVRKEWGSKKIEKDEAGFKAEVKRRFDAKKSAYVSTNGSAVDPREVAKMVPEIENGSKSIEYGAARDKIREIQEDTMDALVEAGLISKADAAKLRKEEPDYVPFKSEFDPETGEFVGRAYNNLAEKTFYEAKGRQSSAGDILAHILNDNAMAHNKAIENKAREKLAKLVEAHPELGTVSALGNRNLTEARRKQGGNANVILFKRDGKTMAIELNGSRGKAVAAAFTGVNQAKLPGWMQKGARLWAATATELSPTFAIRNVTKDNIELAENVIKEMGYVKGTKFIGKYVANQVKSSAALAKYVTTGKIDTSSTTGKMLQEFIDAGGMIGGYGTEGYTEISRALSSEQIAKEMKRGTSAAKAVAKHTLHSIEYLNKMSEMTSRFNAYRTQRSMGMSAKEAALWSRRTLTDFNRKGDMTGVTNVLRMFSNSTLGATAKAATGLVTTKGGLALSAGLLANGAAQALIEHMANADEDEKNRKLGTGTGKDVSEYDRKSSFWLYRNAKTGKITKVGAHNGPFQLINYIGNCAMRVALGDMTAKDMAKELGMSAVELASAFSGWGEVNIDSQEDGMVGAIKAFAASVVPSSAQVIVEPALNTDYAGRKVFTEKGPSEKKPYYLRARKNTPEWAKNLSETMNRVTGGNEFVSGDVDVPAEVIQKVAEFFGKNAAKDVITAYETGKAIINGNYDELESRMVPVKRDFVRDAPDSTSRYFNAKSDFEKDAAEFTGLRKTMSADERKKYIDEHPWVLRMDSIRKAINDIDELRKYEAGFVKNGRGYSKRKDDPPKELVEKWKSKRLQLQAKILELMGM